MSNAPVSPPPEGAPPVAGASPLPPDLQTANASKDDRSMAMIAHLLGLVGFIGPLILFLVKKDTASKFLLFHMKQSLFYQVGLILLLIAMGVVAGVGSLVTMGIMGCVLMPILMLAWLGAIVYLIYGAVQVNGGKDFEYYYIGPWVRKSL